MTNFRTSVINLERPGDPGVFSDKVREDAALLISRYPEGQSRSALLPLLHLVQSEQGYVTPDGIAFCADVLDLTKAQVSAVATFYTMYKRQPTGEYLVSVCTNTLCGMLGGDEIFAALKEQLDVENNETSADGKITIEHAECLAACDYAPTLTVNYEYFDNQTVGSARNLVSQLQSGERPTPTRGAPLCTFKQIERQVAGLFDEADLHLDATASGVPTEVGVKLAIERGETAPSYALDTTPEAEQTQVSDDDSRDTLFEVDEPKSAGAAAERKRTESKATEQTERRSDSTGGGAAEGPSESDAPLETAESDPANTTDPAGETEKED